MATTSRSTTVLAGLADIRGWQEEFYRDLHQYVDGPRGSWLFAQKMLDACQAVKAAP